MKRDKIMNVTLEISKELNCDVLVCGGGVSGFASAVAAARGGAETILVESGGFLGGTATKGLVGPFMTSYDAKGEKQIIKGLFSKLVDRMVEQGEAIHPKDCPGGDSRSAYRTQGHIGVTPFNVEALKRVMEEMCLECGVKLLYHTLMIGCDTENGLISKVYCADGNDIVSIKAKSYIDTTATAALAYKAGAQTVRGNDDGILQTSSMFFIIGGVDKKMLDEYMDTHTEMSERYYMDIIEKGKKDGTFPCGTRKLRIFENPDGTWTVNMAQIDEQLNELDTEKVTEAEISQRQQILKICEFLKNNIPALKNIYLVQTASDIGIRESRRIVGKTVFCHDDILSAKKFDDRIAVCANSIDIHQKDRVAYTSHSSDNYYIPFSCLVSKDIGNLLTAGKSLSADRYAFAAVRVMPPCIAMGEAVGVASAIACKQNINVSEVDYRLVQKELLKHGAVID